MHRSRLLQYKPIEANLRHTYCPTWQRCFRQFIPSIVRGMFGVKTARISELFPLLLRTVEYVEDDPCVRHRWFSLSLFLAFSYLAKFLGNLDSQYESLFGGGDAATDVLGKREGTCELKRTSDSFRCERTIAEGDAVLENVSTYHCIAGR